MEDKVALVTGASRGIGAAIASHLAAQGCQVVGTATSADGAAKISEQLAGKGHGVVMQLQDSGSIADAVAEVNDRYGMPTILVNNAGITRDNLLLRMSAEEWGAVMNTNLTGTFLTTKAVIRGMLKARFGRIVNVGSVVASTGNAGQSNYVASKAGLEGFTRSLAHELASRNITVNCVAPGFVETDMTAALSEAQTAAMLDRVPLARMGRVDDIAAAVVYLAGEGGGYITGQTLHVNGGLFMA